MDLVKVADGLIGILWLHLIDIVLVVASKSEADGVERYGTVSIVRGGLDLLATSILELECELLALKLAFGERLLDSQIDRYRRGSIGVGEGCCDAARSSNGAFGSRRVGSVSVWDVRLSNPILGAGRKLPIFLLSPALNEKVL